MGVPCRPSQSSTDWPPPNCTSVPSLQWQTMLTFLIALLLKVEAYSPTTSLGVMLVLLTCMGPSLMTIHSFYDLYMGEDHGQTSMRTLTRIKHSATSFGSLGLPSLTTRLRAWSSRRTAGGRPNKPGQGKGPPEVELKQMEPKRVSKVTVINDTPVLHEPANPPSSPPPAPPPAVAAVAEDAPPLTSAASFFRRLTAPPELHLLKEHTLVDLDLTKGQAADGEDAAEGVDWAVPGAEPSDPGEWVVNPLTTLNHERAVAGGGDKEDSGEEEISTRN